MAKPKTVFVCSQCAAQFPKWAGQCADCGAWNSLHEQTEAASKPARFVGYAGAAPAQVTKLGDVRAEARARQAIGLPELDRVLGGGLVAGSVTLLGGDPGIGKSTLLLQVQAALGSRARCLYVTGEESLEQVAMRAQRLGLDLNDLLALTETCVEQIIERAYAAKPDLIVVDSIQTMYSDALTAAPGSVSQVRESAARLVRFAKQSGSSVFLVGHVTKEGGIAGPRVLEHMVDAVLYFEGDSGSRYRVIRALKNRFGAANELGIFAMTEKGLREVANPSAIFLSGHSDQRMGSAVLVTREGTRPLLLEVQALVEQSHGGNPRRVAVGLDGTRLVMLLAVLHRLGGVPIFDQDVFVNVVGGMRVAETAADLPTLLAIASSFRSRPLPRKTVIFGEVGLAGEVRPVYNGEERLKEAAHHGFERAIVSAGNAGKTARAHGLDVHGVETLSEALEVALRG
jgi:DNA repair protein RadA/Sms